MKYIKRIAKDAKRSAGQKAYNLFVGVPLKIAGTITGLASLGGNEPGIYDNIKAVWEAPQIAYQATNSFFTDTAATFLGKGGLDAVKLIANPIDNIARGDLEGILTAAALGTIVWNADKPFKFAKYLKNLKAEESA